MLLDPKSSKIVQGLVRSSIDTVELPVQHGYDDGEEPDGCGMVNISGTRFWWSVSA